MHEPNTGRAAVLVPGGMRGPHVPLLAYAAEAAAARGALPHPITWPGDPAQVEVTPTTPAWVCEQVQLALDRAAAPAPMVIAKSLGTCAAPLAAARGVPAIWFTPVLTGAVPGVDPAWVIDGLRRARAPYLLVGGTGDRLWDGALARDLTPHVLEVAGADHGMMVEGPLARSAAVLGEVITAVERFLDRHVWR